MPHTRFFSPSLTDFNSLSVSKPPPPCPHPHYCCHLLFALHGLWLYPRGYFASSPEFTYEHTNYIHSCTEGEENILAFRGFAYQMCCQITSGISCQGTVSSPRLSKRKDSNKSGPQCDLYNFYYCILFIHINSALWMSVQRDHFIRIVNLCYWCWCQELALRQVVKHPPRSMLMLHKNGSL